MRISRIGFLFLLLLPSLVWSGEGGENQNDPFSLFEQGKYKEASDLFLDAAQNEKNAIPRSRLLYNAACSLFQDFSKEENPESLERAVWLYYRVLELNGENRNAAHNLEIARKKLLELENSNQENRENRQDRDQDNNQKNSNNQNSELAEKQKSLSERQDQSSREHQQEQENLNNQTEQAMKNAQSPGEKEQLEKALEKQQQALSEMQRNNPENARKLQEEAAGMLNEISDNNEEENDTNAQHSEISQENAVDQDIQQILNAEQSRQDKSDMNDQNYNIVEKNW